MNKEINIFKNTYVKNGFTAENTYRTKAAEVTQLPDFDKGSKLLPSPFWQNHEEYISMYSRAWEMAFSHVCHPDDKNGFVSSYLDTAYNGNIFMWDSVFITHFARYGRRVFPFQGTLDNFYAKQHRDGFICREIRGSDGGDSFHRYDPVSTGPNVLAWSEMAYFHAQGDRDRLDQVFPALCGFHEWLMQNRTWKDGSYWSSGWGTGMDNIPRLEAGYNPNYSHGHMSWIDANLQQYMNADILLNMGFHLERWQEIEPIETEKEELGVFIKNHMRNRETGFLHDLYRDGSLCDTQHIGAFWALHTDLLDAEETDTLVSHLKNRNTFNPGYVVPSLAADHPRFRDNGRYWQGGIWAPSNYMILSGLVKQGYNDLAHDWGVRHLEHIFEVYQKTGTFFEYYSPTEAEPGLFARKDFVGWTGLVPISVLFEFVFGIQPRYDEKTLVWNISLTEEHGIDRYPFGPDHNISLKCLERPDTRTPPVIEITAEEPFILKILFNGTEKSFEVAVGPNRLEFN